METKLLHKFAGRLGIRDETTLKKAAEFLRIYNSKATVKTLNDIAKTVLCLDLAAATLGVAFDKEIAITLSGLKKKAYINHLHTSEKILGLDKPLTVSELCVQLSCTVIKDTAERIYEDYRKSNKKIQDFTHPQYIAAAVYTACKLKQINVEKSQLVAVSRLKPSQWKELVTEFQNFTKELGLQASKAKTQNKNKNKNLRDVLNEITNKEFTDDSPKKKHIVEEKIEEYEIWRARILDEAKKALELRKS